MIRVVTIGGECGSGRAEIGRQLADCLGWKLIDNSLIEEIARAANVDPALARRFDECIDHWFHRLQKALWRGGYEGVVTTTEADLFDADTMAELSRRIIREAAEAGKCVIVGRGGTCILQDRSDIFHVFIYAPLEERMRRVRGRSAPKTDVEEVIESTDRRRQSYIRRYFSEEWTNRRLYDLMICSSMGDAAAVASILAAIGGKREL